MKTPARVHQQQVMNDSQKEALQQWFTEQRWKKVYPILSSQDEISLRVLEFLTDPAFIAECERQDISLAYYIETIDPVSGETHRRLFNLPEQLAATQCVVGWARMARTPNEATTRRYARRKKFMEPFARQNRDLPNGGRFEFGFDERRVETNVAQLQFMRFVVENNILDWVRRHHDEILTVKSSLVDQTTTAETTSEPTGKRRRTTSGVVR